jgi:hypothetical protein
MHAPSLVFIHAKESGLLCHFQCYHCLINGLHNENFIVKSKNGNSFLGCWELTLFPRFHQALCPKITNILTSGDNYSIVISLIIIFDYIE